MFMNLQKTLNEKKTGDNVPIILGYTLFMPHFGGCLREKNKKGATSTYIQLRLATIIIFRSSQTGL